VISPSKQRLKPCMTRPWPGDRLGIWRRLVTLSRVAPRGLGSSPAKRQLSISIAVHGANGTLDSASTAIKREDSESHVVVAAGLDPPQVNQRDRWHCSNMSSNK
jgi:hypothetical protein